MIISFKKASTLALVLFLSASSSTKVACYELKLAPPNHKPYSIKYDDGTKSPLMYIRSIDVANSSGSFSSEVYEETNRGYTIRYDETLRAYVYLDVDDSTGELINTRIIARRDDNPSTLKVRRSAMKRRQDILVKAFPDHNRSNNSHIFSPVGSSKGTKSFTTRATGTLRNLVIPIMFSDHTSRNLPTKADLNILMNNRVPDQNLAPHGSVRDYYLQASFNQLTIESTIADWVTIDFTEAHCADGVSASKDPDPDNPSTVFIQCIRDALDKVVAAGIIDFNQFDVDRNGEIDGITFLHSGYDAANGGTDAFGTAVKDRIWSHKWALTADGNPPWDSNGNAVGGVRVNKYHISPALSGREGTNIGTIGVIAHEMGHFLDLPDLYARPNNGQGIGHWGLMAYMNADPTGQRPVLPSAWSKKELDWVTPTVVQNSGDYSLERACDQRDMIQITKGFPEGEYLLIENRQLCGFDSTLPGNGLAIFHIDEQKRGTDSAREAGFPGQPNWPENNNHLMVALLQADGNYDLEGPNTRNFGDATDLFNTGDSIGPNGVTRSNGITRQHPNTNTYQNGNINDTGITISNIRGPNANGRMTFNIAFAGDNSEPTSNPAPSICRNKGKGKGKGKGMNKGKGKSAKCKKSKKSSKKEKVGKGKKPSKGKEPQNKNEEVGINLVADYGDQTGYAMYWVPFLIVLLFVMSIAIHKVRKKKRDMMYYERTFVNDVHMIQEMYDQTRNPNRNDNIKGFGILNKINKSKQANNGHMKREQSGEVRKYKPFGFRDSSILSMFPVKNFTRSDNEDDNYNETGSVTRKRTPMKTNTSYMSPMNNQEGTTNLKFNIFPLKDIESDNNEFTLRKRTPTKLGKSRILPDPYDNITAALTNSSCKTRSATKRRCYPYDKGNEKKDKRFHEWNLKYNEHGRSAHNTLEL